MPDDRAPIPRYELHLAGRLSAPLRQAFAELEVRDERGGTRLSGEIPDTDALDRIVDRIEGLGLRLVELRRLPDQAP